MTLITAPSPRPPNIVEVDDVEHERYGRIEVLAYGDGEPENPKDPKGRASLRPSRGCRVVSIVP